NVEEALLAAQLNLYYAKGGEDLISPYVAKLGKELNGNFTNYIADAFETSIFRSKETVLDFLEDMDKEKLDNDPLYQLSNALLDHYRAETDEEKEQDAK